MQDATSLPQDLDACHALIAELAARLDEMTAARYKQGQEIDELRLAIQKLLARLYGYRRERFEDPTQLKLDFEDDPAVQDGLADVAAEAQAAVTQQFLVRRRVKQRQPRSEQFPEHLPRYEVTAETPEPQKHCQEHGDRQLIGYDQTETLEFERPKLRVRVTRYPKCACQDHPECGVGQPPRPRSLVEGNRYDTSVAAEIIVGKYGYHLPVYRQQDWFAGSGWMPQRSTLLNIMASGAYVLEPLYWHYADFVRTTPVIPTDETGVMLLLPPEIPQPQAGDAKSQQVYEVISEARAQDKSHVLARMWVELASVLPNADKTTAQNKTCCSPQQ